MTSVLVVDDSRFVRTLVGSKLTDHGYEVGTASDGQEAVELVEKTNPDVVTMDVRMPGMDGIDAVEEIMSTEPTPIVMLSAYTGEGAEATIRALARGAVDFVHKPGGEVDVDVEELQQQLVDTIEAVQGAPEGALVRPTVATRLDTDTAEATLASNVGVDSGQADPGSAPDPDEPDDPTDTEADADTDASEAEADDGDEDADDRQGTDPPATPTPTVVIGASTGGPVVIETILEALSPSLDARILVVQHMPTSFTGRFASHLDSVSDYDVSEAEDGATVGPGEVLVAKGDFHMVADGWEDDRLRVSLSKDDRLHGVRPAADVTMEAIADLSPLPSPLVGVVLTGMGKDGSVGIEAIGSAGGTTIVQDEATSTVFSMPRRAIETGHVDHVLPATDVPEAIHDVVGDREREEAHV